MCHLCVTVAYATVVRDLFILYTPKELTVFDETYLGKSWRAVTDNKKGRPRLVVQMVPRYIITDAGVLQIPPPVTTG